MRIIIPIVIVVLWIAVWWRSKLRVSSATPTWDMRVKNVLKILLFVIIFLGALGKEVVQRYYSSPSPEPQLGRTVTTWGTDGGVIYISPETDKIFWAWSAICAVTFIAFAFWPSKNKTAVAPPTADIPAQTDYPIRLMPRPEGSVRIIAWAVFVVPILAGTILTSCSVIPGWMSFIFLAVALVAAGVVLWFFACPVKCPQCKNLLHSRQVKESPGRRRIYQDCPICQITWKSQTVSTDD